MLRVGLFAALQLAAPTGLLAQEAAAVAGFRAVNDKEPAPEATAIAAEAKALLAAMVEKGQAKCAPAAVAIDAIAPATAARLVIEGMNAKQVRNGWTANARLEGCPEAAPSRLIVLRMADASLLVRVINTGETLTTASQMRDTSASAAMAAVLAIRKAVPGCEGDGLTMGDTRVASLGDDLGPDVYGTRFVGSWSEVWRFAACGASADVTIGFKADGNGGVFSNVRGGERAIIKP